MSEHPLIAAVTAKFPTEILSSHAFRGDETVVVRREALIPLLTYLRDDADLDFNFLMDVSVVDYLTYPEPKATRFEVVYHFYSLRKGHRFRVKVPVAAGEPVDSAAGLWEAADWAEREAWEMYGIMFNGHPNLRRLLTHMDFVGYPLRKDFPLTKRQPLSQSDTLMDEMEKRLQFKGLK